MFQVLHFLQSHLSGTGPCLWCEGERCRVGPSQGQGNCAHSQRPWNWSFRSTQGIPESQHWAVEGLLHPVSSLTGPILLCLPYCPTGLQSWVPTQHGAFQICPSFQLFTAVQITFLSNPRKQATEVCHRSWSEMHRRKFYFYFLTFKKILFHSSSWGAGLDSTRRAETGYARISTLNYCFKRGKNNLRYSRRF